FFSFSWLSVSEHVGSFLEKAFRRTAEFLAARKDRKLGEVKKAEREEQVVAKQVAMVHEQPVRIEPAITTVSKSPRIEKEKQQVLFTAPIESGSAGDLPAVSLLDMPEQAVETVSAETIEFTSRLIEKKLSDFGVRVTVIAAQA